ncbi:MAG: SAM hydrolase/SAM-dependent halogenase family protein [Planctomycetota bacterium]|jgi:S-adenosylmethionine hydrolase
MKTGYGIVTLLSDFGPGIYVAAMKGVILAAAPDAKIVDICHTVRPQNVREAAFILGAVAPTFPAGTVHCIVVDPGVGTQRRIVLLEVRERIFLAPDNGVLTRVLKGAAVPRAYSVENDAYFRRPVSPTFHGRDIFAPVAAAIAAGERPLAFGPKVDPGTLILCDLSESVSTAGKIVGEIVFIDAFGNLVSNITEAQLQALGPPGELAADFHGHRLPGIRRTYGDVRRGEMMALVGSLGCLEIAVACGSAAGRLPAAEGDRVTVRRSPS